MDVTLQPISFQKWNSASKIPPENTDLLIYIKGAPRRYAIAFWNGKDWFDHGIGCGCPLGMVKGLEILMWSLLE